MFGQPKSAKYLSDGQVKRKKVFCPVIILFFTQTIKLDQPTFEMTPGFKPFTVLMCVVHQTSQCCIVFNRDYNSGVVYSITLTNLLLLLQLCGSDIVLGG